MSTSAASLALPTLTLRTRQPLCSPQCFSSSLSLTPNSRPISISTVFVPPMLSFSSRFVPRVAVSSEFDQEEDVLSDGDSPSFAPDLKLFVGNLPFSVDSAQLAELFENAGNVEMVEEVEAAAHQFNGYEMEGRALRVNSGPPPARNENSPRFRGPSRGGGGPSDESNRVHVGNLDWGVDNLTLETLFRGKGKVLEARVIYDRESGRSRGFGFVTYSSPEEVNSAIQSLDGVDLNGRAIRVSLADSKPKRF
ncbi:29 kDa ribonucleoprotein A, chloroplastic isoform X2 [Abrus precatorius]|uniref:29 kDa ribonucleoprotein A, chloroplastic isoform X2 n=1 Tax=Abrus precatorius TaxID=3816 RepID=A0A8B8M8U8_ABRPR|nr:29 kDa ribonucleoprotein A, chloroplastic isoform X2 [Abrus precatorius]